MEGRRLILNDGTVIDGGSAGLADGFLWLWFPGWTMADVAAKVFNPAVMKNIYFQYGEEENTYTGYTVCTNLMLDGGEIAVCMIKG